MEEPGLELVPIWEASTTGSGLTHYITLLGLIVNLFRGRLWHTNDTSSMHCFWILPTGHSSTCLVTGTTMNVLGSGNYWVFLQWACYRSRPLPAPMILFVSMKNAVSCHLLCESNLHPISCNFPSPHAWVTSLPEFPFSAEESIFKRILVEVLLTRTLSIALKEDGVCPLQFFVI